MESITNVEYDQLIKMLAVEVNSRLLGSNSSTHYVQFYAKTHIKTRFTSLKLKLTWATFGSFLVT